MKWVVYRVNDGMILAYANSLPMARKLAGTQVNHTYRKFSLFERLYHTLRLYI